MQAPALLRHAAELLRQQLSSAQPPDAVAQEYFRHHKYLGSKERRAIAELVFGTLRCLELSEFLLQRLSRSVPAEIAREWLLLVAFGILSPAVGNPHIVPLLRTATLSEADSSDSEFWCRLLQAHGWSSAEAEHFYRALRHGLCSLKAAVSQVLELPPSRWEEHHWQQFAAACALPLWLVREWLQHPLNGLSAAQLLSTCQALQRPALPCLRVNTLKAHPAALVELLRQQGIAATPTPFSPVGIRLWERVALSTLTPYRNGAVEVQEESSQLVGYVVAPEPHWRIWDACAGAGGKALHLAVLQQDRGEIVASDVAPLRLRALQQRQRRAGLRSILTLLLRADGTLPKSLPRSFDAVLIDAPCSGLGTLRRTPTLKWRLTPEGLQRHSQRQLSLLLRYSERVRPGGVLVYATCSLLPHENQEVIARFCRERPEFSPEPATEVLARFGIVLPQSTPAGEPLQLLPSVHGTDGFFIARFRRSR